MAGGGGIDESLMSHHVNHAHNTDLQRYFCHSCSAEFTFSQSTNHTATPISCIRCGSQFIEEIRSDLDLQMISNQIRRLLTVLEDDTEPRASTVALIPVTNSSTTQPVNQRFLDRIGLSLARRLVVLNDSDMSLASQYSVSSTNVSNQSSGISSTPSQLSQIDAAGSTASVAPSLTYGQRVRRMFRSLVARSRHGIRNSQQEPTSLPPAARTSPPTAVPSAEARLAWRLGMAASINNPSLTQPGGTLIRNEAIVSGAQGSRWLVDPDILVISAVRSQGVPTASRVPQDQRVVMGSRVSDGQGHIMVSSEDQGLTWLPVGQFGQGGTRSPGVAQNGSAPGSQGSAPGSQGSEQIVRPWERDLRSSSVTQDLYERGLQSDSSEEMMTDVALDPNVLLLFSLINRLSRFNDRTLNSRLTADRSGSVDTMHMGQMNDYVFSTSAFERILTQFLNELNDTGPAPASATTIENLQVIPVTDQLLETVKQCSICMDDFVLDEKVKQLPCSHAYHPNCITTWLQLHGTCPVCRLNLPE